MAATEQIELFHRRLAALAAAGAPLEPGLRALARDMRHGRLRRAAEEIARDLEAGMPLPRALERHRAIFPPLYVALVEAGAAAGDLAGALRAIALESARAARMRRTAIRVIAYPACLIGSILMAFAFCDAWIARPLQEQLASPSDSQFLIPVSAPDTSLVAIGMLFAFLLPATAALLLRLTPGGRWLLSWLALRLPWIGRVLRKTADARFCRALASLLAAGTPLPQALRLAAGACGNAAMRECLLEAAADVEAGKPLAEAIAAHLPPYLAWGFAAPSRPEELAGALDGLASVYETEAEEQTRLIISFLHPLGIVIAGMLILSFASSFMHTMMAFSAAVLSLGSGTVAPLPSPKDALILISKTGVVVAILAFMTVLLAAIAAARNRSRRTVWILRRLGAACNAHRPLADALVAAGEEVGGAWRDLCFDAANRMAMGEPVAVALRDVLPGDLHDALAAAHDAGRMAEILPHLAEIARRRAARRLEGALLTLYPAFLLLAVGAAATVLRTMAQKLLPEISLQQQPQFPDAFGMLSTAAFLIGLVLLISFAGRLLWDLCAPVGRLLAPISARDDALEVFCRACGVFLRSGMPLPEALVRAAAATHSPAVQRQAGAVSRAVERGVPFGDALREAWRWPRGVLEIVRTGNAAGRSADAFDHAADFLRLRCEREAVRMRRRAAVLIVACGALVGATVYAVFSFITNTQNFVMGL